MKKLIVTLVLSLMASTTTFASEDSTTYRCRAGDEGLDFSINANVVDTIGQQVFFFSKDSGGEKIVLNVLPTQQYVNYHPFTLAFRQTNDGGEDIFRFESIAGTAVTRKGSSVVSFKAKVKSENQSTQTYTCRILE